MLKAHSSAGPLNYWITDTNRFEEHRLRDMQTRRANPVGLERDP